MVVALQFMQLFITLICARYAHYKFALYILIARLSLMIVGVYIKWIKKIESSSEFSVMGFKREMFYFNSN